MNRIYWILFLCLIWSNPSAFAQDSLTQVLTFEEFYRQVLNYHPIARQVNLLSDQAKQQIRLARGGFDPKLSFQWDQKQFSNTEYYDKWQVMLKMPTWAGLTPEAGIRENQGEFLNPESYISPQSNNQQVYAGVTLSVGQGLFIDARRATLKQALIFAERTEFQQVSMLNDLLLQAAFDYWDWYMYCRQYEVIAQNMVLAQDIFNRTKLGFDYGEVSVVDTVQAKTNLLNRKADLLKALTEKRKATLMLSLYLWDSEGEPVTLSENARPSNPELSGLSNQSLNELLDAATRNHPKLVDLSLKNESLAVDRSLAREQLKPKLDLKYFLLDQPVAPSGEFGDVAFNDNYTLGVSFSIPLFLRKERAKLQQTELKLQQNQLEQSLENQSIINKVNANFIEVVNTAEMIDQQQEIVENYRLLLNAERLNLENGESDLFRLNTQTDKLLESQGKLILTETVYQKKLASLYWSAGTLYNRSSDQ